MLQTKQHDCIEKGGGHTLEMPTLMGSLNTFHFQTHQKRKLSEERTAVTAVSL